jgi:hypothetical protein
MYRALRGPPLLISQRIFGPYLSTEKSEGLLKVVRGLGPSSVSIGRPVGICQALRPKDWKE